MRYFVIRNYSELLQRTLKQLDNTYRNATKLRFKIVTWATTKVGNCEVLVHAVH